MNKKNSLHEDRSLQDKIDKIDEQYAKINENESMKILFNAAREYLMEKGKNKNGY